MIYYSLLQCRISAKKKYFCKSHIHLLCMRAHTKQKGFFGAQKGANRMRTRDNKHTEEIRWLQSDWFKRNKMRQFNRIALAREKESEWTNRNHNHKCIECWMMICCCALSVAVILSPSGFLAVPFSFPFHYIRIRLNGLHVRSYSSNERASDWTLAARSTLTQPQKLKPI